MLNLNFQNGQEPALNARNMNAIVDAINNSGKKIDYLSNYVTPEMFGAKGDGLTDDTAAVQAAVDFAADRTNDVNEIVFNGTYLINSPVTLHGPSNDNKLDANLVFSGTGTILCAGINAFDLKHVYNVIIRDISFRGGAAQGDWYVPFPIDEDGTRHEGVINAYQCARITVKNCNFYAIDMVAAIFFDECITIAVDGCLIDTYVYGGVLLANRTSVARITNNRLLNLLASYAGPSKTVSYPISVSSSYRTPLDLPGQNITIANNYISNTKPHWEGIDAHGGLNITITGNTIINCLCGISLVHGEALSDITITGNVCRITDFSFIDPGESPEYPYTRANIGIQVSGGIDDGEENIATNVTISGNVVDGFGRNFSVPKGVAHLSYCGIKVQYAKNVAINGNVIVNNSICGIALNQKCDGVAISNNIIKGFSNTTNSASLVCVLVYGDSNYATITGNTLYGISTDKSMRGIEGPAVAPGKVTEKGNQFIGPFAVNTYNWKYMVSESMSVAPNAVPGLSPTGTRAGQIGDIVRMQTVTGGVWGYLCTADGNGDEVPSTWVALVTT